MNPERLLNIPCTVHTVSEAAVDIYGDPTLTSTDTRTVCWVDRRGNQGDGAEESGPTNWQTNTLDLYLPPGTTITGDDRVTIDRTLYEVVGPPHEHRHPVTQNGVYVGARIQRVS